MIHTVGGGGCCYKAHGPQTGPMAPLPSHGCQTIRCLSLTLYMSKGTRQVSGKGQYGIEVLDQRGFGKGLGEGWEERPVTEWSWPEGSSPRNSESGQPALDGDSSRPEPQPAEGERSGAIHPLHTHRTAAPQHPARG